MSDSHKISVSLSLELYELLAAHVRQGRRVSDVIREALGAYLGRRPTERPPAPALSDTVTDVAVTLAALAADVAEMRDRLVRLEEKVETRSPGVRQRRTGRPPARPTPADTPRGHYKLTPRQRAAMRRKRAAGIAIKVLMEEYDLSKATVHRYLKTPPG